MAKKIFLGLIVIIGVAIIALFVLNKKPTSKTSTTTANKQQQINTLPDNDPLVALISNPASTFCNQNKGTLFIAKKDNGEYGVCSFPGDKQCEEWAMKNGDCPVGGVDVSKTTDPASRYCLISGGKIDGQNCILPNKKTCPLPDFYSGKCGK